MSDEQAVSNQPRVTQFALRKLLIVAVVATVCLALVAFFWLRAERRNAELERQAKLDQASMDQIVKDVEAVRTKLGRVPKDQAELEQLLGKPMPEVNPRGYKVSIYYFRKSDRNYFLYFPVDIYHFQLYESDDERPGWLLRSNE